MIMAEAAADDRDRNGEEYYQTHQEDQTPVGHELEVDVSDHIMILAIV